MKWLTCRKRRRALSLFPLAPKWICSPTENLNGMPREGDTNMSSNWITTTAAVTMISKNSHHSVSPHHIQKLVNRGKIGTRSLHGGEPLLKRSDVEATRVAVGTGNTSHSDKRWERSSEYGDICRQHHRDHPIVHAWASSVHLPILADLQTWATDHLPASRTEAAPNAHRSDGVRRKLRSRARQTFRFPSSNANGAEK